MRKIVLACILVVSTWALVVLQWYLHSPSAPAQHAARRPLSKDSLTNQPPTKWDLMDLGPFFSGTLNDGRITVPKAICVQLGSSNEAAICFDTELLRFAAGWMGGFLKFNKQMSGLEKPPQPNGARVFTNPSHPGWSTDGAFTDLRPTFNGLQYGNLPNGSARYKGLYLHGRQVILNYAIGQTDVLDMPGFEWRHELPCFTRTIEISESAQPLILQVSGPLLNGEDYIVKGDIAVMKAGTRFLLARVMNAPKGARWTTDKTHGTRLHLPANSPRSTFQIHLYSGSEARLKPLLAPPPEISQPGSLTELCRTGSSRHKQVLTTKGILGHQTGAFQVDTLTLPEQNPWKSWIRPTGLDFFADGRAAVCSLSGDVWIVSGLDRNLEELKWRRFATGLYQPLGLKIVQDTIYVTGRDQITRLHDRDHDGEADFYENFNNDAICGTHFHEFCFGLDTDSSGNFYFSKGANLLQVAGPHQGSLMRVTPDGKKLEVVATGFRTPNGLCVTANDEVFVTDNQGPWMPTSKINLVREGGFYGNPYTSSATNPPTRFNNPVCWIPHTVDNSSADPVQARTEAWGPFNQRLFYLSYGSCSIFHVMPARSGNATHGAVVKLPLRFNCGLLRGRFNPADGQLYVCGMSGWQTSGTREGALYRIRYTGQPARMPLEFAASAQSLRLTFSDPLDDTSASDLQNYSIHAWDYPWKEDYNIIPGARTAVEPKGVRLLPDGRTVEFEFTTLSPTMQLEIRYNLEALDGGTVRGEVYATINEPDPGANNTQARTAH